MKNCQPGDTIFFTDSWDNVCEGVVVSRIPGNPIWLKVRLKAINKIPSGGESGCPEDTACQTFNEALVMLRARDEQTFNAYCAEITDEDALVRFLLFHVVCGEYKDEPARRAAIKRANDLGFEL